MSFTTFLRNNKQINYESKKLKKTILSQSENINEKLSFNKDKPILKKKTLTWKNLSGHYLEKNILNKFEKKEFDEIKILFDKFLDCVEEIFGQTSEINRSAFLVFRSFNQNEKSVEKLIKEAQNHKIMSEKKLYFLKSTSQKLYKWHLTTGGKFFLNLTIKKSINSKINEKIEKREFGIDLDYNLMFEQKINIKNKKSDKFHDIPPIEKSSAEDKNSKFDVKWIYKNCKNLKNPEVIITQLIEALNSKKSNEKLQEEIFLLLGETMIEFIFELIYNRKSIIKNTKSFCFTNDCSEPEPENFFELNKERLKNNTSEIDLLLPEDTEFIFKKEYDEIKIPSDKKIDMDTVLVPVKVFSEFAKVFDEIEYLNPIQSKCFPVAYHTNENILVCAPTGAGKTNIAVITIIKQIRDDIKMEKKFKSKMVYITPMKALAREIAAKLSKKLTKLGIKCAEFTGDMQLTKKELERIDLVVSTPEKWDVVTRQQTQFAKETRLLIIDEVHLLHEDRGPVIESIVARTKIFVEKIQSLIRIIGLSATLPNYQDVAIFLGVNSNGLFFFDKNHRPVPLEYDFVGISTKKKRYEIIKKENEMCYLKTLEALVIKKQVLIFVHSRKETARTANFIMNSLQINNLKDLIEPSNKKSMVSKINDKRLRQLICLGIGIHHAGMSRHDRTMAENLFSKGYLRVLVSTATLAWGVNLPAHTVIIKGTSIYNSKKGKFVDLGGLDVMQIFGRAGRPQFDNKGKGILITSKKALKNYAGLIMAQIPIESNFIADLENNLNAEIVSGTITNIDEAVNWLAYTYLFIRMLRNPLKYNISYDEAIIDKKLINRRKCIIENAANELAKNRIIRFDKKYSFFPTNLGRTASYYYIDVQSVNFFITEIRKNADFITDEKLLSMLALSKEFEQIQLRDNELTELSEIEVPHRIQNTFESRISKIVILIQVYILKIKLFTLTLISDMNYINQNIIRITRALFKISMNENKPVIAKKFLDYSKMCELQYWGKNHPLGQFKEIENNIIKKLETRGIEMAFLREEVDKKSLGKMISNFSKAKDVMRIAKYLPQINCDITVKPVTINVLKFSLILKSDFYWERRIHGESEGFWIWLLDTSSSNYVHFKELVHFYRREKKDKENKLEFLVSLKQDSNPSQFILRTTSDKWLGTEQNFPISFKHLFSPINESEFTPLFDLNPLPTDALKNNKFISFYKFKTFNQIQTQVFHIAYHTDKNILLGAPTGSGKTVIAEIAIFRKLKSKNEKVVYIAPLKALARQKYKDWKNKFLKILGVHVSMLTGDLTPETNELIRSKVLITTPEKWDGISRNWKNRRYVKLVTLVIIDEIHLLGTERGCVLEAIVSRIQHISNQTTKKVRLIGLSTALANAKDLGTWLGIKKIGLYNFKNELRTVPLEIHVAGYPGKSYCPRMNLMNKPCYHSIITHSSNKPVLVFVSSRRQTRLTAFDLVNFLTMKSGSSRAWNKLDQLETKKILTNLKDESLKRVIEFGIGIHHAGLINTDRKIVEELFVKNKIQILVCTSTLAWGVNFPAHLVVIKGTEYFDAKTRRYVEMPLTDILQMIGRAGRPGFDNKGIACILVHEKKKNFYLKFLHEPFPLESCFHENFHDHFNSEIASETMTDYIKAKEYIKSTFLYQRVRNNPSFYGIDNEKNENFEKQIDNFFVVLLKKALTDLKNSGCITTDIKHIKPLKLGKISSLYYISYKTAKLFNSVLSPNMKEIEILKLLSKSFEYEELPMRHNEEKLNENLSQKLKAPCDLMDMNCPHTKTFILLQCHMQRVEMPICDFETDLRSVLDQSIRLIQALIDISCEKKYFSTTINIINLMQNIIQAVWFNENPFINIPFFDSINLNEIEKKRIKTIPKLCNLSEKQQIQLLNEIKVDKKNVKKVIKIINTFPFKVTLNFKFELVPPNKLKGTVLINDNGKKNVLAPLWPKPRKNNWILLIGCPENDEIFFFKRMQFSRNKIEQRVNFVKNKSTKKFTLILMSDSFIDFDQIYEVCVD